jgi:penicillin-binding protein 2
MMIGGRPYRHGRCWVASKFSDVLGVNGVKHHPVPSHSPHRGHDGNADGFLTLSDALERGCNVYFETLASRLGLDGLSYWMEQFGLGRPTGIGIEESRGRLPNTYDGPNREFAAWTAGIGQGQISATPLQMANVAATIARGGIWMRPRLLQADDQDRLRALLRAANPPTTAPSSESSQPWWMMPESVDLKLPPEAMLAARKGMTDVVNSTGGTGNLLSMKSHSLLVAGKTGTAEAAKFRLTVLDADGKPMRDENGRLVRREVAPSTVDHINADAPWYIAFDSEGTNLKHAWIIGFAPANDPQVAFAVMVEYGGSGGQTAATIAKGMLDSAIQHGYLSPGRPADRSITTRVDQGQ